MFEERSIAIKAYNLNTILAEKIESILARNVSNTRARDFYDVYILLSLKKGEIEIGKLREAIWEKAEERNSIDIIENRLKHLTDIKESNDLINIWVSYKNKYPYAAEIEYADIIKSLKYVLEY